MVNPNTRQFWNNKNITNFRELTNSPIYQYKINYITKIISEDSNKLLNIGVGNGYLEKIIVKINKNIDLYGIDIANISIDYINKHVKGHFVVANAKKIPFNHDTFDTVLALDILEHLTSKELTMVMTEIRRVLKSRGQLIISIPINESVSDRYKNRHMYIFKENNLKNIFSKFNFKVVKIQCLSAFKNYFKVKNIINELFGFKKHNLAILICKKI